MQTLDDFLKEARDDIDVFERTWREKNTESPESYPLLMEDGNEGLWWEFLRVAGKTNEN